MWASTATSSKSRQCQELVSNIDTGFISSQNTVWLKQNHPIALQFDHQITVIFTSECCLVAFEGTCILKEFGETIQFLINAVSGGDVFSSVAPPS